jgi:hypothetical protein
VTIAPLIEAVANARERFTHGPSRVSPARTCWACGCGRCETFSSRCYRDDRFRQLRRLGTPHIPLQAVGPTARLRLRRDGHGVPSALRASFVILIVM